MVERHHLYQRECLKCGCPLAFIVNAEGKTIPLDLRSPVYSVVEFKNRDDSIKREAVRTHINFVSHFTTCKFANEFSRKNDKPSA